MPKLFEYFGLLITFYSNEHQPIHVHGKYQGRESKAEIIIINGEIIEIKIKSVKGKEPLKAKEQKLFSNIVEHYKKAIINKWIDYFVYNKEIRPISITKRIK